MAVVNPCCCWNIKDGAVTIGLWSLIYCLIQLAIFGWQMAAIKYEKDRAADTLLPNYYEYGRFDIPTYYESYWQSPEERYYTGLFIIQILCLISAFFLLFASISLVYGAHTYTRCLIWPWIPCMLASILSTLAYCIMWWTGDVRSYWLVLTILEMLIIFINIYCLAAIILFYRSRNDMDFHSKRKQLITRYGPDVYDEYKNDNYYMNSQLQDRKYPLPPDYNTKSTPHFDQHNGFVDYTQVPPAVKPIEQEEPHMKHRTSFDDDLVANWVKQQRVLKELPDHAESEPINPPRPRDTFGTLKHAHSVPSLYAETSGATSYQHGHRHRHHKHRSSSRRHGHDRRRSSSRHRRHSGTLVESCSSESYSTDYTADIPYHSRHRSRSRDRYSEAGSDYPGDKYLPNRRSSRRRREKGGNDREGRKRGPRKVKHDRQRHLSKDSTEKEELSPTIAIQTDDTRWSIDPQQGFTFPQQIIIPPSNNSTFGPDGKPQAQTYQINSEIRISYDQNGRPTPYNVAIQRQLGYPQVAVQQPQQRHPQAYSLSSVV